MVKLSYDPSLAEHQLLAYLRSPYPRTAVQLVGHLKHSVSGFYPASRPDAVVPALRARHLSSLLARAILVKYRPGDVAWSTARGLAAVGCNREGRPAPRKLSALYQINFFHLQDTPTVLAVPTIPALNPQLVGLFYGFLARVPLQSFFWELVNLFLAWREDRDELRPVLYAVPFADGERAALEAGLELAAAPEFGALLKDFPLRPDISRAADLIRRL